jgi:uncharacterized membrane protein YdjX (TVP38/TMEM64 family)
MSDEPRPPTTPEIAETERAVARMPEARKGWFGRAVFIVLFLSIPMVAMRFPAVRGVLVGLAEGLRDGGGGALALYWLVCALSGVLASPIVLFAGVAGFAFGPLGGAGVAIPGITLHACSAWIVGRTFLRARVAARVADDQRWAAIDGALRDEGFRIALLLRLTPLMPQNLLSYAFSASPLPFTRFALSTALGLAPIITVQATLGSFVQNAAQLLDGDADNSRQLAVLVGSAVATLVALYAVTRIASRALRRAMARHAPPAP